MKFIALSWISEHYTKLSFKIITVEIFTWVWIKLILNVQPNFLNLILVVGLLPFYKTQRCQHLHMDLHVESHKVAAILYSKDLSIWTASGKCGFKNMNVCNTFNILMTGVLQPGSYNLKDIGQILLVPSFIEQKGYCYWIHFLETVETC